MSTRDRTEQSSVTLRDDVGFWAWVTECVADAAADGEEADPETVAAQLRQDWPLLSEACRDGYRLMPSRPVQRTEVWMMLGPEHRPAPDVAQQIIGTTLQSCYLHFALYAALLSSTLLCMSLILSLHTP